MAVFFAIFLAIVAVNSLDNKQETRDNSVSRMQEHFSQWKQLKEEPQNENTDDSEKSVHL